MRYGSYTFRCPVCFKFFTYEQPYEPTCTGPSEMRHEHEMAIMQLVRVDRHDISPAIGIARAAGPLIITEELR